MCTYLISRITTCIRPLLGLFIQKNNVRITLSFSLAVKTHKHPKNLWIQIYKLSVDFHTLAAVKDCNTCIIVTQGLVIVITGCRWPSAGCPNERHPFFAIVSTDRTGHKLLEQHLLMAYIDMRSRVCVRACVCVHARWYKIDPVPSIIVVTDT